MSAGGESKVWAHSSAETWSPSIGVVGATRSGVGELTTYDLDTDSIKREKGRQPPEYTDGYGPPPGTAGADAASYVADPSAFYGLYPSMGQPTSTPMMHHELDEQLKRDKEAVYAHPLYPLLVVLFEKCELATSTPREQSRDGSSSSDVCSSASFKDDLNEFVRHTQENADKAYYVPNPQLDQIMLQAIQMLRFHLLELEKVHELCDNFCNRYVTCLKGKMPLDIVGDERASSSQPPMSPSSMGHGGHGPHSSSPSMAGAQTPMNHYPPPYETQTVPLPENPGVLGHMEGSSMGYGMAGIGAPSSSSASSSAAAASQQQQQQQQQSGQADHPLVNGGTLHTTAGASQTLHPVAVSSPSACSSVGGLRQDSTPLSGETPHGLTNGGNSIDSMSEADSPKLTKRSPPAQKSKSTAGNGATKKGPGRGRRHDSKMAFSRVTREQLKDWLYVNFTHPYPSEEQKKQLANETGLTILQVNNWFINARRRIVQPMIDQSNRAGRAPPMNVFKNRRRNRSEQSPGPSPESDSGANYSPDPQAVAAATAMQAHYSTGADLYNMQRTMFNTGYTPFGNTGMPFMPQMMSFMPQNVDATALGQPWVSDISAQPMD